MNYYKLANHYSQKFPEDVREDIYQEGCIVACCGQEKYMFQRMVDWYRKWTKGVYKRKHQNGLCPSFLNIDDLKIASFEDPCEGIYIGQMVPKLNAAIEKLPSYLRFLVWLYYYKDIVMRDIGHALGISEAAVFLQIKKAIELLREELQ